MHLRLLSASQLNHRGANDDDFATRTCEVNAPSGLRRWARLQGQRLGPTGPRTFCPSLPTATASSSHAHQCLPAKSSSSARTAASGASQSGVNRGDGASRSATWPREVRNPPDVGESSSRPRPGSMRGTARRLGGAEPDGLAEMHANARKGPLRLPAEGAAVAGGAGPRLWTAHATRRDRARCQRLRVFIDPFRFLFPV